jgi:putative lipoprotein
MMRIQNQPSGKSVTAFFMLSLFQNKKIAWSLSVCLLLALPSRAGAQGHDPWWGQDKRLHFGISAALAATGYAGTSLVTTRSELRTIVAVALAFSTGIAKEAYDIHTHGDASVRDLTWDLVGTTTGTVVAWLVDRYLF